MNSQIYCLPQKFGWNTVAGISPFRAAEQEKYAKWRTQRPYFLVNFGCPAIKSDVVQQKLQNQPKVCPDEVDRRASKYVNTTDYMFAYGPDFIDESIRPNPPLPPVTFNKKADPVALKIREFDAPMNTINYAPCSFSNDPDRGLYEWRELKARPGLGAWHHPKKILWYENVGERSTLLPVRLRPHDPTHEKERWDSIRNLVRRNAISYGYRKEMPGYLGHKQMSEHITSDVEKDVTHPNEAMESTMKAGYKEFPLEHYDQPLEREVNKHQGPLSRMVTLTHPFNPFTQQSAYCNVGAIDTQ